MVLKDAIKTAVNYLGEDIFTGLNLSYEKDEDISLLSVDRNNNDIKITYGQLSLLFRGLTLVKEKINEKQYNLSYNIVFKSNGLMLDCSRNGVVKNDKVKEMILLEALMGHNRLLLYTEDTYELKDYPYFGYLRGAYNKEDIKEFVAYGESFGVELIPCIQTLGHLYQALKWYPMYQLSDGNDTLLVDNPDSYKFIEAMLSFCRECFKSKDIHVGMDESTQMGLHRYLRLFGYKDRVEMFSRHLQKVIEMCHKYDFVPMIWSDMYFRLNNKDEEYYRDTPLPEETVKLIPPGVNLVYWDYYHNDVGTYRNMIKFHKQAPNHIIFAGGSWRWKGFTPSIHTSIDYTKCAFDACVQENVKDVFITAWGDNGNECSFFSVLPVVAEAAIYGQLGHFDEEATNSLLVALTGDTLKDFLLMDLPDEPGKKRLAPSYNPSKFFLYQDILLGIFDDQVKEGFAGNYREFAGILKAKSPNSRLYGYIYDCLSKLCDLLAYKVDLGVKIRKSYKDGNKDELAKAVITIDEVIQRVDAFHDAAEKQWMTECRPFGYENIDGRLGFLKNRLISAKQRINDYLCGKIEKIEELEKDILPFDGFDYEICWNSWIRNVSTSN